MFGRILLLIAITGIALGPNQPLLAQEGIAASAVGSAASAAAPSAAAPSTLWRFLGIPQGFQRVRDAVTNRRGNRPRLERRPPVKRLADPANLESDFPAIKKAAEIKQAEDMKLQKIKAIKYLAKIGCGCYDKEGEITEALIAATDDCTPDVREAAIEAIKDAASGECCRKCGSTSCCNEQITKRLSEMAYERDDTGCPIEPNADIRRLAARVLKRCCPGGPPTGPIEEDIPEAAEESEQIELIPAPDGEQDEEDEDPIGETDTDEDDAIGEDSDDMDLDDAGVDEAEMDAEGEDQYQDDPLDDEPAQDDEVSLVRPAFDHGVHFRLNDAGLKQPAAPLPTHSPELKPFSQVAESAPSVLAKTPQPPAVRARPISNPNPSQSRLIRGNKNAGIYQVKPVVVADQLQFKPVTTVPSPGLRPTVVTDAKQTSAGNSATNGTADSRRSQVVRVPEVVQVAVQETDNSMELTFGPQTPSSSKPTLPKRRTSPPQPPTAAQSILTKSDPQPAPRSGATGVIAGVVSINLSSGHIVLQGAGTGDLQRKMTGRLYRPTADGPTKISDITVVRVERDSVRVRLTDRTMLERVKLGDRAIFR